MSTIALTAPAAMPGAPTRMSGYLVLAPSCLVLTIFFALPMGTMIGMSFMDAQTLSPTLLNYQRFLSDGLSLAGLYRTAVMSILVAVCVTVLGSGSLLSGALAVPLAGPGLRTGACAGIGWCRAADLWLAHHS
jgi:ABC-type sugar transport system permease subunit